MPRICTRTTVSLFNKSRKLSPDGTCSAAQLMACSSHLPSRLLIAPNLFSAAVYSITGLLIHALGAQHSRLSAKNFLIIFGLLDLLAIVLQAAGAGVAAQELKNSDESTGVGTDVMVSGICVQIVSMIAYLVLGGEFLWKSHKDPRYREREE